MSTSSGSAAHEGSAKIKEHFTFNRSAQAVHVLKCFLLRWLWTAALVSGIAGTIYGYRNHGKLSPTSPFNEPGDSDEPGAITEEAKRWFNVIIVGLQIFLAVNITVCSSDSPLLRLPLTLLSKDAISEFAEKFRWKILSLDYADPEVVRLNRHC